MKESLSWRFVVAILSVIIILVAPIFAVVFVNNKIVGAISCLVFIAACLYLMDCFYTNSLGL